MFHPRNSAPRLIVGLAATFVLTMSASARQATTAPAETAADLPAAEKILARAIEEMGGRKAFEAIESMETRATMDLGGQMMDMEVYTAQEGRFLIRQIMPMGMGEMAIGYNGSIGWQNNPMMGGYTLMGEDEVGQARMQAQMHTMVLRAEDEDMLAETIGKEAFRGEEAWMVRLTEKPEEETDHDHDHDDAGDSDEDHDEHEGHEHAEDEAVAESQTAYFSVESGLILGIKIDIEGMGGATLAFSDWEEVGDLKLFKEVTIEQSGPMGAMEILLTYSKIELNEVDMETFELPDEIKALTDEATSKPSTEG